MGLTIHYNMQSSIRSVDKVRKTMEKMYQLALDLPFDEVYKLQEIAGDACDYNNYTREENLFYVLSRLGTSVKDPLYKHLTHDVCPTHVFVFNIRVGAGSESVTVGLVKYPSEIQVEDRTIKTKLTGWQWQDFCKTQYASNPKHGGLPNFLKCHISLITLLERIGELPGIKIIIDDEGKYGTSKYSDDYKDAYALGLKPTYVWHPASHNIQKLIEELDDYNQLVAAYGGFLKNALAGSGMTVAAPIAEYPNFEYLEFKGTTHPDIGKFLGKMSELAKMSATNE